MPRRIISQNRVFQQGRSAFTWSQGVCEPGGTFQQNHTFFYGKVREGAIQGAVGQEVAEGLLALGAPWLFFVKGPVEDAVGTVDVVASFDHGHALQGDVAEADGAGEVARFGRLFGGGACRVCVVVVIFVVVVMVPTLEERIV